MHERHNWKTILHHAAYLALSLIYAAYGAGWIDTSTAAYGVAVLYALLAIP
jgi:hypothetical protein